MCMQSNKYLPGRPLFKSVLLFLFSTQVKLLESLETMDKESFDTKFGGVLTYTTVSLFFELRNIPVLQSVWADCRWRFIVVRCLWQFFSRINNWLTRQYVPTIAWRIFWGGGGVVYEHIVCPLLLIDQKKGVAEAMRSFVCLAHRNTAKNEPYPTSLSYQIRLYSQPLVISLVTPPP